MPPGSPSSPPRITFHAVAPVLEVVASRTTEPVLVGGQAVNFWAEKYAARVPALRAEGPFASADLDFVGGSLPRDAHQLAVALSGTVRQPPLHYGRSVIVAQVTYADGAGHDRDIQFLRRMCGMNVDEVIATSIPFGTGLRVMHPVLCLESRIHNLVQLPQDYDTEPGRQQARVAVLTTREFLLDALAEGEVKTVLAANERIYRLARNHARHLAAAGVAPFAAVISDPRLPAPFNDLQYPRMQRALAGALHRRAPARDDRDR